MQVLAPDRQYKNTNKDVIMPLESFVFVREDRLNAAGADVVLNVVHAKRNALICVATGSSPKGVYAVLAESAARLRDVRILKLDEWGGIPANDPSTCDTFIRQHILEPWGVPEAQFEGFASDAPDPDAECVRVRARVQELGGIDLCVLGMGADGHIGLNYPSDSLPPEAHVTGPETLQHAMLDAAETKPTHGYTLGFGEILQARRILLIVNGAAKAEAAQTLLTGGVTTQFPASLLKLHPAVTCLLDREAAGV